MVFNEIFHDHLLTIVKQSNKDLEETQLNINKQNNKKVEKNVKENKFENDAINIKFYEKGKNCENIKKENSDYIPKNFLSEL